MVTAGIPHLPRIGQVLTQYFVGWLSMVRSCAGHRLLLH